MFALLATVFHTTYICNDSGYSLYSLLFFTFNNNHVLCMLCDTCLLCTVCDSLGRWRGCIECGQSIVCLSLFRGHTCVCACACACVCVCMCVYVCVCVSFMLDA